MTKNFLMVATIQDTVEAFLIPHIKLLEREGYKVSIAANVYKDVHKDLKDNTWINIPFNRNPFTRNSFRAITKMRTLIKENDFETIHFHTPVASFLGRYAAMKEKQKNIIYTAHGFHFYKGAPIKNWILYYSMEFLAAKWTDKILTINEEDYKNSLKLKVRKNGKFFKINGVGLEKNRFQNENIIITDMSKELKKYSEKFKILTLAELNKNKNHIQVLKALKGIVKQKKDIIYFIAGKGSNKKELEEYIKENNLEENVKFLGQVEQNLVPELIKECDLVISTSKREGLGLNLIEGAALGKAILATNNRGHKEIISDKNFLVEIGDYKDLEKKILNIYDKKIIGKHDVEKFYLEEVLKELKKIYGDVH